MGLKFVWPSTCNYRTLADFLSRLTAFRLGAGSFKIKMAPIPLTWLSWHFLIGWAARERRQIVLVHHTLADKTFWDLALSHFARQAPILLQTCLNSPHTTRQVKIFCRPAKNRLVCGGLNQNNTFLFADINMFGARRKLILVWEGSKVYLCCYYHHLRAPRKLKLKKMTTEYSEQTCELLQIEWLLLKIHETGKKFQNHAI